MSKFLKNINLGSIKLKQKKFNINYFADNIDYYFPTISNLPYPFIFQSKDISPIYGRLSLMGFDPILKISGKDENFCIELLQSRGKKFFDVIDSKDFNEVKNFKKTTQKISGLIKKEQKIFSEEKRPQKRTIADSLKIFLEKFKSKDKTFCGLYGAFSYDFVRLFEQLPTENPDNNIADFTFFIYDSFFYFDHLKEKAFCILLRENQQKIENDFLNLSNNFKKKVINNDFKIENGKFDLNKKEFKALVRKAKNLAQRGELFEIVFSRTFKANFTGSPFAFYKKYRQNNPSPYMFYFDFGKEEFLIGASPEMMLRVENNLVHCRPISGTCQRSINPIEDHENMLYLLSSDKERSELDMLIDLGRNDLARICEKGIKIKEYRTVEKYSRVMHTIAHLTGKLKKDFSSLDAYIACSNAGTLTGAPKFAAMCEIEKWEKTRRGYYGGGIGYFSFSGDMDTGIIIRTAHLQKNKLSLRVGATLLYDSDEEGEFLETENKARAFLDLVSKQ